MPGLFGLYGLAGQSLVAFQTAMNAVSHNVANAATPGFHRQRVELGATPPDFRPDGALGTGVRLQSIRRIEDRFLEAALRRETPLLARYSARADVLARAELAFGEPTEGGLATLLDDFFDGWDDLASAPEDLGARESVVRLGVALTSSLGAAHDRLAEEQSSLTGRVARTVDDANRVIEELRNLNRSLVLSTRGGTVAADLEDRRDVLIETLAELVGASATIEDNGSASVRLGGRTLVQHADADRIEFDEGRPEMLVLQGSSLEGADVGGRLGGLMDARDGDLADTMRRLDELAARIAEEVNVRHRAGLDRRGDAAGDFFVIDALGDDGISGAAAGLRVSHALQRDASKVAAGSAGAPGDNAIALDLAALRDDPDGAGALLRGLVSSVGARARESADLAEGQRIVVEGFEAQRASVSGVSLDEEAAELLRFQRSYQAAARIVTTVDEMARTLLAM